MISYSKKIVFIHRGKSGGNSISKVLAEECSDLSITIKHQYQDGINRFEPVSHGLDIEKHAGLRDYIDKDPSIDLNDFFKFSVIRNPYTRLVSAYFSPHRIIELGSEAFSKADFMKLINDQRPFRDFVCLSDEERLDANMDRILKFENLNKEFDDLGKHLGFSCPLPTLNKGHNRDYRQYYDDEILELVSSKFSEEIQFFNYEF